MQLQFQDGIDLDVAEAGWLAGNLVSFCIEFYALEVLGALSTAGEDFDGFIREIGEQIFARVCAAGRTADNPDDVVEVVDGNAIAEQDVLALFRFAQVVTCAANDHFAAVFKEEPQELEQAHLARLSAGDGQQDHAERFLHLCELVEVIEDELRLFAALDLDYDAHAFSVRLIAHVGDALDFFVLHEVGDALHQARLVYLIRNFRDDDVFAVFANLLDGSLGAHDEAAATFLVSLIDPLTARDITACRKVGAGNKLHHFLQRGVRFFNEQHRRVNNFFQVVGRNIRGHTNRDTACAIDEQIGYTRWQNDRLLFGLVEVWDEIDGFAIDVSQKLFADSREARLGVTHRRGGIAVDRTEIPLAIHQRIAHAERLRHAHQRIVDRRIAVWVVFAEDLTNNLGAFAVGARRGQVHLVHAIQNAPVHRFEAVAHVGQCAPDDYAHRVVEIRLPHLGFDIYRD